MNGRKVGAHIYSRAVSRTTGNGETKQTESSNVQLRAPPVPPLSVVLFIGDDMRLQYIYKQAHDAPGSWYPSSAGTIVEWG